MVYFIADNMVNLSITKGKLSITGRCGYLTYNGVAQYADSTNIICRINKDRPKNVRISLDLLEITQCSNDTIKILELPGNKVLRQSIQVGPCVSYQHNEIITSNKTVAFISNFAPGYQTDRRFSLKYTGK